MRANPIIPRHLKDKVDRELEPGEWITWLGMPTPQFFTPASIGLFLFSIPWTGFAIFWICGASGFQIPDFSKGGFALFPLFGVPFVLVGLSMFLSPLWEYWKAFKTVYVITNKRAITFDSGWSTTIRSYPPGKLQEVYRVEKRDGSGDVIIARRAWQNSEGGQQSVDLGFMRIKNPREIEQMLNKLAEQFPANSNLKVPPEG